MIRMFQSQTGAQAKDYFNDALSRADYYIADQETNGRFQGRVAARLGLDGKIVTREDFHSLCDNIHPQTKTRLTQRTVDNRRVGYDISFHAPKSVSILHALGDDKRVLETFRQSVHDTMHDMQDDMKTRVRVGGKQEDRATGELIYADFIHQTARPVSGHAPDPHLHCHCFTFNATFDDIEKRFKAGQFGDIKRDMPYYQARFQKRLADGLNTLGYQVRKTSKGFELAMVPQAAIGLFSKRTNEIGRVAKEKSITAPKELDQLGSRTRSAKEKAMSMSDLRHRWRQQLIEGGLTATTKGEAPTLVKDGHARSAIDYAIEHEFARQSVRRDRQVLAAAYTYAVDTKAMQLKDIDAAFTSDRRIHSVNGQSETLCTTLPVYREEQRMIDLARDGRGVVMPIKYKGNDKPGSSKLDKDQSAAVHHVLSSPDRVVLIRGGAGTGKTTLMKEAAHALRASGLEVHAFAPSASASRGTLRDEGFEQATTVAALLTSDKLQDKIAGQVVWIDEAGMLGAKDTVKLLELAEARNARLVLSGDTRQHSAVDRGDAMRILQAVAKLPVASTNKIYRQTVTAYRDAVGAIADGRIRQGFETLERMNAIKEVEVQILSQTVAQDYLSLNRGNKSVLVVTPTNEQRRSVTEHIREGLKEQGTLKGKERIMTSYRNLYLTDAAKRDPRNIDTGHYLRFTQNIPGVTRGTMARVTGKNDTSLAVSLNGQDITIDLKHYDRFEVYKRDTLPLNTGDQIRITANGSDKQGRRLDNGKALEVTGFDGKGNILAKAPGRQSERGYTLRPNFGHIDHAYCVTSHNAQGRTVDHVLIAQPSATLAASNAKQFYVSVSRGRSGITLYTDSKQELLQAIERDGDRLSASELQDNMHLQRDRHQRYVEAHKEPDKINRAYERRLE